MQVQGQALNRQCGVAEEVFFIKASYVGCSSVSIRRCHKLDHGSIGSNLIQSERACLISFSAIHSIIQLLGTCISMLTSRCPGCFASLIQISKGVYKDFQIMEQNKEQAAISSS